MKALQKRTQEDLDTANAKVRKLDTTLNELKQAKIQVKDLETELKHCKDSLQERDAEINTLKLTAENAMD